LDSIFGESLSDRDTLGLKLRHGLLITAAFFTLFLGIVVAAARPLVVLMGQDSNIIDKTVEYVRLETLAYLLRIVTQVISVLFVCLGRKVIMYDILVVQMVLTILFDLFLMSSYSFSANLGVNGIAICNLIVNCILLGVSLFVAGRGPENEQMQIFRCEFRPLTWLKEWAKRPIRCHDHSNG
jgi:Na+-driven multidrug efflux pump